jgi:hypothetical protein
LCVKRSVSIVDERNFGLKVGQLYRNDKGKRILRQVWKTGLNKKAGAARNDSRPTFVGPRLDRHGGYGGDVSCFAIAGGASTGFTNPVCSSCARSGAIGASAQASANKNSELAMTRADPVDFKNFLIQPPEIHCEE